MDHFFCVCVCVCVWHPMQWMGQAGSGRSLLSELPVQCGASAPPYKRMQTFFFSSLSLVSACTRRTSPPLLLCPRPRPPPAGRPGFCSPEVLWLYATSVHLFPGICVLNVELGPGTLSRHVNTKTHYGLISSGIATYTRCMTTVLKLLAVVAAGLQEVDNGSSSGSAGDRM